MTILPTYGIINTSNEGRYFNGNHHSYGRKGKSYCWCGTAALREMVSDYWVKTYLPQIVEIAKSGKTRFSVKRTDEICKGTQEIIYSSFEKLGIKVIYSDLCYCPSRGLHYRNELTFSWN